MKKKWMLSILLAACFLTAWGKYHPEIRWKHLENEKFSVIFPEGFEKEALLTLETAQRQYARLAKFWGMDVPGTIRVVLSDFYDNPNGSATMFPFNRIEIYLTPAFPDSELGGAGEWISQVLIHELTHIFNLNAGSGFFRGMRSLIGNHPALYPFAMAPVWLLEGFPVYWESESHEAGRLNGADYYMQLAAVASSPGGLPPLEAVYGEPTSWPGPSAKYFYGAWFCRFLADRYGQNKLAELQRHLSRSPIPLMYSGKADEGPLTVGRAFAAVFGADLETLWSMFRQDAANRFPRVTTNHARMATDSGFYKRYPVRPGPDLLAWVDGDYRRRPSVMLLNQKTGQLRRLLSMNGINGMAAAPGGNKLYVTAEEIHKNYYSFSDLYEIDAFSGKKRRITKGARVFHPSVSSKGLLAVRYEKSSFRLTRIDPVSGKLTDLPVTAPGLAFPAQSPDGQHIAVSVRSEDSDWRLAVWTSDGKWVCFAGLEGESSYDPSWEDHSRLFFVQEYGKSNRPASFDLEKRVLTLYGDESHAGIKYLEPLPGSRRAMAVFYTANGFDLGEFDWDVMPVKIMQPPPSGDFPAVSAARENPLTVSREYSPFPDLWPKYFSPYLRRAGNEYQPGIQLHGTDAVYSRQYSLEAFYGVYSGSVNLDFSYTLDRLNPSLTIRYRDLTDLEQSRNGREYRFRDQLAEISLWRPLALSQRSGLWAYGAVYFERESFRWNGNGGAEPEAPGTTVRLNGLKAGCFFNSARRYYDSISGLDGVRWGISWMRDSKALGSDFEIDTVLAEYKQYIPLFRPGALAARLTGSHSWGDARRLSPMGGAESYTGFVPAGNNPFKLMRGFPSGYFSGAGGWLLNAEMRLPLFKIERPLLWARSVERLFVTLFADVGNTWIKKVLFDPAASFGAEASMPVLLGDFRFVLSAGCAVGAHPYRAPRFYFRLGESF